MRLSKEVSGHILLLLANLFYGINFSVAKIPMPNYISANGIVLLRCLTATLFFWVLAAFIPRDKHKQVERKDWGIMVLAALFGVAINQLLFFKGLDLATPISASIIMTCTPIAVLVVAVFMIQEKLTWQKGVGLFLGLTGASTLILSGNELSTVDAPNPTLGNLLIFINAISYAIYLVISKRLIQKYNAIVFMKWVFLIGMIMVIPFGIQDVYIAKWNEMSSKVIWSIGFILFFVSCLTYYFNTIALKHLLPSTVGMYIYSQPVFAVLIAIFMGSDHLDWIKMVSAIFIFVGVYLVSFSKTKNLNHLVKN